MVFDVKRGGAVNEHKKSVDKRIKCARSAHVDSSVYIYLYIAGVPFPRSWARNLSSPRGVPGAKNEFLTFLLSETHSSCPGRLQRMVLG